MPKPYVLKNSLISQQKVERLLKSIKDNAECDRIEASQLLNKVKEELDGLEVTPEGLEGYVKLVNTALAAINQMGSCNDKILKLASLIQKFIATDKDKNPSAGSSLFAQLAKQAKKDDPDDD